MCIDLHLPRLNDSNRARPVQYGFSLLELIVFILIVSIAMVGVLSVLNVTTANSADPLIRKQLLSIAEALLEEVEGQPFTVCDPNDANAPTATAPAFCAADQQVFGFPVAGVAPRSNFNNVGNFCSNAGPAAAVCTPLVLGVAGSATDSIPDSTGVGVSSPPGYWATISMVPEALGGIPSAAGAAAMDVIHITVTVNHVNGQTMSLEGYRSRWARPML